MSRRRYLSTDAGRDKVLRDVARQSMFAHSFYLLAIACAGDDCALPTNDPDELLCEVWPMMARDHTADDVQEVINLLVAAGLWEYSPSGRLRYPPSSFYKHQSYITAARRGEGGEQQRNAPETAHDSPSIESAAQISANQRKSAQNDASFPFSSSSSSSSLPPTVPTEPTEVAPMAADAAPDAPPEDSSRALVAVVRARDPLFDALQTVFPKGPRTDAERGKWNTAAFQLRKGKVAPEEVLRAAENWPNVMSGATMTPMGIASNLGLLLDGPQVNGRSNGVTHSLQQTLRQNATLPPDDMALMRAAKAARRPH